MTLYELLHNVSIKLSETHSEEIYEYFIHAMDDNGGFLRTRYCHWDKELDDHRVPDNIKTVLLAMKKPFDFEKDDTFYEMGDGPWKDVKLTSLKMQLFYTDMSDEENLQAELKWCEQMGYRFPILVDLQGE